MRTIRFVQLSANAAHVAEEERDSRDLDVLRGNKDVAKG